MHNVVSDLSFNGGSTRLLKILVEKSLYGMGKKRTQDAGWGIKAEGGSDGLTGHLFV